MTTIQIIGAIAAVVSAICWSIAAALATPVLSTYWDGVPPSVARRLKLHALSAAPEREPRCSRLVRGDHDGAPWPLWLAGAVEAIRAGNEPFQQRKSPASAGLGFRYLPSGNARSLGSVPRGRQEAEALLLSSHSTTGLRKGSAPQARQIPRHGRSAGPKKRKTPREAGLG
jgi:hypothetical protein